MTYRGARLYYFYDALCGWCYGFSPVLQQFYQDHQNEIDIKPVSGGMVLGEREGPIGQVAPYIKQAYRTVEERTGVRFGNAFLEGVLEPGTAVFSSWLPAVALSIVKAEKPEAAVSFAHALQRAIYYDGLAPAEPEAYGPLGASLGWKAKTFVSLLDNPTYREAARADFVHAREWGVGGFPTLILQQDDQLSLLSQGYLPLHALEERLSNAQRKLSGH